MRTALTTAVDISGPSFGASRWWGGGVAARRRGHRRALWSRCPTVRTDDNAFTGPPVVRLTGRGPVPARPGSAYSPVVRAVPAITKAASPMARLQETEGLSEDQRELLAVVREFVDEQILPVATELEHRDEYPADIVKGMREMGLFGLMIPRGVRRGGGVAAHLRAHRRGDRPRLDERQRHHQHPLHRGVDAAAARDRRSRSSRYLPRMATGEVRGAFSMSEPGCGSDVAAIRTRAVRAADGADEWTITGQKMWLTNGGSANLVAVLTRTDAEAGRGQLRSTSG